MSTLARYTTAALVLAVTLLGGCTSNPYHAGRNFALAGTLADAVSTQRGLNRGCIEQNPLYGKKPTTEKVVAINLLVAGSIWWLSDILEENDSDPTLLYILGGLRMGLAANNEMVDC